MVVGMLVGIALGIVVMLQLADELNGFREFRRARRAAQDQDVDRADAY